MFARSNQIIASFGKRHGRLFIAFALGTVMFIFITGGKIFDPTNHDWLIIGDSAQHYFGGAFFRHTPMLQWPLGKNYPFGMELSGSIVFTDSIPLAALLTKLFGFLLPASFQYFGIWIWVCFVLQAQFGQLLLGRFIPTTSHLWLGTCFLLISPPMIYRLIHQGSGHIALTSHWLILASIWLYFRDGKNDARWAFLISLCWLIQAYFVPMVAAAWLASLVKRFSKNQDLICVTRSVLVVIVTSAIVMQSSGYFIIGSNFNPEGWNYVFRWQPLSLVDSGTDWSIGWSHFLPDLDQLVGDTEGFSFLGIGVLAMAYACVCMRVETRKMLIPLISVMVYLKIVHPSIQILAITSLSVLTIFLLSSIQKIIKEQRRSQILPLVFAFLGLSFYSMTNRVGFGQHTLFQYPLFTPLRQFTETFRTHGRSIWPAYYLLIAGLLITTSRTFSRRTTSILLTLLLVIQFVDSMPALNSARTRFTTGTDWISPFTDPMWKSLSLNRRNVIVVPPLNNDKDEIWIAVADYALNNELNTNSGYFSRYSQKLYTVLTSQYVEDIQTNHLDLNTIYIISDDKLWDSLLGSNFGDRFRGTLNGFHVIAP